MSKDDRCVVWYVVNIDHPGEYSLTPDPMQNPHRQKKST